MQSDSRLPPGFRSHEHRALGLSHAEGGAPVLERWSFPQELARAVRHPRDFRFEDESAGGAPVRLALPVNGAGEVTICLCEESFPVHITEARTRAVGTVGPERSALPPIPQRVEPGIEDLADLLWLDIIPSTVYTLIAEIVSGRLSPSSS